MAGRDVDEHGNLTGATAEVSVQCLNNTILMLMDSLHATAHTIDAHLGTNMAFV